jgi:hypothetical protein
MRVMIKTPICYPKDATTLTSRIAVVWICPADSSRLAVSWPGSAPLSPTWTGGASTAAEPHIRTALRGGMSAPMSQKSGINKPTMNMTQWPFRREMRPSVTMSTK